MTAQETLVYLREHPSSVLFGSAGLAVGLGVPSWLSAAGKLADAAKRVAEQNAAGAFAEVGKLNIGIGVATGPMVCGNVGGPSQMEYTVIGDTVNLSARLTSQAAAGEVWVSEATAEASSTAKFEALAEIKVKGREKPVTPRRLIL